MLEPLLTLDDVRLRRHFARVERRLRAADTSHLSEHTRLNRAAHLDRLQYYRLQGLFPRNHHPLLWRSPCFIDRDGRACAVADLMIASGHSESVRRVADTANHCRISAMRYPELDSWAQAAGLSRDELALIQPGYPWKEFILLVGFGSIVALPFTIAYCISVISQGMSSVTIPFLCSAVAVMIGLLSGTTLISILLRSFRVRQQVRKIHDLRGLPDLPRYIEALGSPDYKVLKAARDTLRAIGPPAVPGLIESLKSSTGVRQQHIVWTLGDIGDERAIPVLIEYLADARLRSHAKFALKSIGTPAALAALATAPEEKKLRG